MALNSESGNTALRLWTLLHRVRDELTRCEDPILRHYGLTIEQFAVLAAIKYLGDPVRLTDLALGLERSLNSVSMLVDRMIKAGLLSRKRGSTDRRVIYVTVTSEGKNALELTTIPLLKLIWEILSPLSYKDGLALLDLLERIKYKTLDYLNPGVDIEEIIKDSIMHRLDVYKQLVKDALLSHP